MKLINLTLQCECTLFVNYAEHSFLWIDHHITIITPHERDRGVSLKRNQNSIVLLPPISIQQNFADINLCSGGNREYIIPILIPVKCKPLFLGRYLAGSKQGITGLIHGI